MYPYAQKDAASVRLQELIRNGQPGHSIATSLDVAPFAENASSRLQVRSTSSLASSFSL